MDKLWRLYAGVAGLLLAALIAIGLALVLSGAVRTDRLADAVSALRDGPAPRPAPAPEEPRGLEEAERRQAADALALREEELRRLDVRVAARQAQVEADRLRVAEAAARLKADREKFEQERQETARTKTDADLAANVPILSRMDGASVVTVLKGWVDATFVPYLR